MDTPQPNMAEKIARAAFAFEKRRTGEHASKSINVVLSEDTLVITLHEALSPAERDMTQTAEGAARMQEFHRLLFASSSEALRNEIKTITGMNVREATAELEPANGAVVQVFTTGTVVQVYSLTGSVSTQVWSGTEPCKTSDLPPLAKT